MSRPSLFSDRSQLFESGSLVQCFLFVSSSARNSPLSLYFNYKIHDAEI